jgi:hypothetical protein
MGFDTPGATPSFFPIIGANIDGGLGVAVALVILQE